MNIMHLIRGFVNWNRGVAERLTNKYPTFFKGPSYKAALLQKILVTIANESVERVLEAGGIDRPLLKKNQGYVYDGLDIEEREGCYDIYDHFTVQSIEKPLDETYDLIISITLLEHVPNNQKSLRTIYESLNIGGYTHHYLPSKWHPYSIALRLVGSTMQKSLIPILRPGKEGITGYPAYFDHCSVLAMRKLMTKQGFQEVDIQPFYRANDYFAFFFPLFLLISLFENVCRTFNLSLFASGFIVSAKRAKL